MGRSPASRATDLPEQGHQIARHGDLAPATAGTLVSSWAQKYCIDSDVIGPHPLAAALPTVAAVSPAFGKSAADAVDGSPPPCGKIAGWS